MLVHQNKIKYMLIVLTVILLAVVVFAAIKTKRELNNQTDSQSETLNKELTSEERQLQELEAIRKNTGADKLLTEEEIKEQNAEIEKIRQQQNQKPLTPDEIRKQEQELENLRKSN